MAPVEYKCPLLMYMYIIDPVDELLNEYDLCYLSSKYRERLTTFSRVQIVFVALLLESPLILSARRPEDHVSSPW